VQEALKTAEKEYFSQPVVGYFPASALISPNRTVHTIDFSEVYVEELHEFEIEFSYQVSSHLDFD